MIAFTVKLPCTGSGVLTGTAPDPAFQCDFGQNALIPELCDGIADCFGGVDEVNPLCESKSPACDSTCTIVASLPS